MLNNIDLFSGIGGFSYAMHGKVRTIAYCDISPTCRDTLKSIMARGLIDTAPVFDDICTMTHSSITEVPSMITGGFPCQDISAANPSGKGLDGKRSSLFFEIIRLCTEMPTIKHVFLENVPEIQRHGMLIRVYKALEDIGFNVSSVITSAKVMGAPHTRRRCYILATRDMSELKKMRMDVEDPWTIQPDNMIRVGSSREKNIMKHRCGMCGNAVVPACVAASYNHLVHGDVIGDKSRVANIRMESGDVVFTKPMWGTPYASVHLYRPYKLESKRSAGVLVNQIWYSPENKDRRTDEWTIHPEFLEWMMGYPAGYTENTLQ